MKHRQFTTCKNKKLGYLNKLTHDNRIADILCNNMRLQNIITLII